MVYGVGVTIENLVFFLVCRLCPTALVAKLRCLILKPIQTIRFGIRELLMLGFTITTVTIMMVMINNLLFLLFMSSFPIVSVGSSCSMYV